MIGDGAASRDDGDLSESWTMQSGREPHQNELLSGRRTDAAAYISA